MAETTHDQMSEFFAGIGASFSLAVEAVQDAKPENAAQLATKEKFLKNLANAAKAATVLSNGISQFDRSQTLKEEDIFNHPGWTSVRTALISLAEIKTATLFVGVIGVSATASVGGVILVAGTSIVLAGIAGKLAEAVLNGIEHQWHVNFDPAHLITQDRGEYVEIFGNSAGNTITPTTDDKAHKIYGHSGDDTITGTSKDDVLEGGDDHDTINGEGGNDYIIGGKGRDIINGGDGENTIFGDLPNGEGEGNDQITGGKDKDIIFGGKGDDTINGGDGLNELFGENGNDTIFGGKDRDIISGGKGDDELHGKDGADDIAGQDGDDTIHGGDKDDALNGNKGNDVIYGDTGADTILGGDGNDTLYGGTGRDVIYGGAGNDEIFAADQTDDQDTLYGGSGSDIYRVDIGDTIIDSGLGDKVYFDGLLLEGAKPEENSCDGDGDEGGDGGDNNPDNGGKEGKHGETYNQSGGGLTVSLNGGTISIEGWSEGRFGIKLEEDNKKGACDLPSPSISRASKASSAPTQAVASRIPSASISK